MEDITKTIMFTSPLQNGQPTTIQYQTADGTILKTPKVEGQKAQDFPAFYTTSNVSTLFFLVILISNNFVEEGWKEYYFEWEDLKFKKSVLDGDYIPRTCGIS